jgi:adenylosuccinate lyase
MHARLREHALAAWGAIQAGEPDPLGERICGDPLFREYLGESQLRAALDASRYLGDAPVRARALAATIRQALE